MSISVKDAASATQTVDTLGDYKGTKTAANSLSIIPASDTPALPMKPALLANTGSIAANATSAAVLTLTGHGTAAVQLSGTFVATVQFQLTVDGTNWVNVTGSNMVTNVATGAYLSSGNMTAAGVYQVDCAGCAGVRVISTAYTSGTVTVTTTAAQAVAGVSIGGTPSVSVSGTVAVSSVTGSVSTLPTTLTTTFINSAASTNAGNSKNSGGNLFSVVCSNTNAAARFVKLYNTNVAPTVGTTTPALTITVPAGGSVEVSFGALGARFSTGISYAITAAAADSDATAVAANEVKALINYN